jgi:hypothetical protein
MPCPYPHDLWPELRDSYGRDSHSFLGRYDGLLSVRLNALGAWCFEVAETSRLCHHAGENRIAVPAAKLAAFTRAAHRMGFILPVSS